MKIHWPKVFIPEEFNNAESYLRYLVYEGAKKRYKIDENIFERIEYEFERLKGCEPYFIMYYHLVEYCHKENIIMVPGFGSVASSIINYCLGITSVDPIRWGLKFESFYLKEFSVIPNIDLNVDATRVDDVFKYLQDTYGEDYVLNACTCHHFDLKKKRSERVPAYAVHPCGVCIFDEPYYNVVKTTEVDDPHTGKKKTVPLLSQQELETMGYIHIDIMSMDELSYVSKTMNLIERTKGEHIDYDNIPLNDKATFAFLSSGHKDVRKIWGVTELTNVFSDLKPSNMQELCNLKVLFTYELYDYKDEYIDALMMGNIDSEDDFDDDGLFKDTMGFLIYHEQITDALHTMSNLDIAICEKIRRYMRYPDYLPIKDIFLKGVNEYGVYDSKLAKLLWLFLMTNKKHTRSYSHDMCYTIMWYRATWLRAHYPEQFKECYPTD